MRDTGEFIVRLLLYIAVGYAVIKAIDLPPDKRSPAGRKIAEGLWELGTEYLQSGQPKLIGQLPFLHTGVTEQNQKSTGEKEG